MIKKVAVCGQKQLAIKCTELLLQKDVEVCFVVPNNSDTGIDTWQPSFRKWAESQKLNIIASDPQGLINAISLNSIDLIFSIYYDRIFTKKIIDSLPHGIVNIHLAPLPKYRGVAPVTMAILNGETRHGVTLHYINEGIDTGDIISQKYFSIKDINANEAFALAVDSSVELFNETIGSILNGTNDRIVQDNSEALYFSMATIDWSSSHIIKNNRKFFNKDTRSLYNWFRAFIFPPLQFPVITLRNNTFDVTGVTPVYRSNSNEKTGTLVEFSETTAQTTALISTHDSYIQLHLKLKDGS